MPHFPKRTAPKGACRRDRLGLISRDPLLRDVARIEVEIADLYARLAATSASRAPRELFKGIERHTRELAALLGDVAAEGQTLAHHPRPTRVRLNVLCGNQLDGVRKALRTMSRHVADCDPNGHTHDMLAHLHRLEAEHVLAPLLQILRIAPSGALKSAHRLLVGRHDRLGRLGVDLPPLPTMGGARPPRGTAGGPPRRFGKGDAWSATGCVERINQARRCGTVRIGDGACAFFSFRALPEGAGGLREGDPVTVTLRRGPLGLTATWVALAAPVEA